MAKKSSSSQGRGARLAVSLDEFADSVRSCKDRLSAEYLNAQKVLRKHQAKLRRRAGVVSVDVGFRMKSGSYVIPPQYVLRVDVEFKLSREQLRSRRRKMLPRSIEGVQVKVLEQRYVSNRPSSTTAEDVEWTLRRSPIVGGVAISRDEGSLIAKWGTLGAVCFKNGSPVYLTNAHIAAPELTVPGTPIPPTALLRQPPMKPGATPPGQVIGRLIDGPVLDGLVDCAAIQPEGRICRQQILGLDPNVPFGTRELTSDDHGVTWVIKVGAKSGYAPLRRALVDNTDKSIDVGDLGYFIGQIVVRSDALFQDGGDSGAVLVVDETDDQGVRYYNIVGLCFASTDDGVAGVACHFFRVAEALGITVNP